MTPSKKTKSKRRKPSYPKSLAHKLRSVRLVLSGISAVQAGRKYGDSSRAVAYWVENYKERGVSGLEAPSRPGRPSKFRPSQIKQIKTFVAKTRSGGEALSGNALAVFIKSSFGITITRQHCVRIIKRLDDKMRS